MSEEHTPPPGPDSSTGPAAQDQTSPPDRPKSEDRNLAVLAHLLGIVSWFIGALVIWVICTDSEYVRDQSREALNFQITVGLAYIAVTIASCATLFLLGPLYGLLYGVVWIVSIIFCILAAVAASRGDRYRYPVCLRLIS